MSGIFFFTTVGILTDTKDGLWLHPQISQLHKTCWCFKNKYFHTPWVHACFWSAIMSALILAYRPKLGRPTMACSPLTGWPEKGIGLRDTQVIELNIYIQFDHSICSAEDQEKCKNGQKLGATIGSSLQKIWKAKLWIHFFILQHQRIISNNWRLKNMKKWTGNFTLRWPMHTNKCNLFFTEIKGKESDTFTVSI